jgi:hypothetical protein
MVFTANKAVLFVSPRSDHASTVRLFPGTASMEIMASEHELSFVYAARWASFAAAPPTGQLRECSASLEDRVAGPFGAVFVPCCGVPHHLSWCQETYISKKEKDEAQLDSSVALSSAFTWDTCYISIFQCVNYLSSHNLLIIVIIVGYFVLYF